MEYFILVLKILLTLFNLVFIISVFSEGFQVSVDGNNLTTLFTIICFLCFAGNICFIWATL